MNKKKNKTVAKKNSKSNNRGRPKYVVSEADKKAVYELAKKGCNEIEIAKTLKISQKTFQRNKDQFSPLVKKGRAEGEAINTKDVENALLKIAKGYKYTEETVEAIEKNGKVVQRHRKIVTKQLAPNVTADIFYLCNRARVKWQNVQKIDVGMGEGLNEAISKLADIYKGNVKNEKPKKE